MKGVEMTALNYVLQKQGNISVLQFSTGFADSLNYVSLSTAIKQKFISLNEVSESGSVNNLCLKNNSEHFVFISDGDMLEGAKQNRVLNTSVFIAPHSVTEIPVSCVEAGRWRYRKKDFTDSEFYAPSNLRRSKARDVEENLFRNKKAFANQSRVWDEVCNYETHFDAMSESSDLNELFTKKRNEMNELTKNFNANKGSNGMAVFSGKQLLCIEIFNRTDVYAEYFPKLLNSAAIDILKVKENTQEISFEDSVKSADDFLNEIKNINSSTHAGVGVGTEKRFSSENIVGFELDYESTPIHIVALNEDVKIEKIYTDNRGRKILNFGQYKGLDVITINRMDREYVKWLCFDSDIDANQKKEIFDEILRYGRV